MPDTTDPEPEDIRRGATIRALRELHGLSSDELGALIGKSGQLIRHIEVGRRRATLDVCRAIAEKFRLPLAAITVEGYEPVKADA